MEQVEYLFVDSEPGNGKDILDEGLRLAGLPAGAAMVCSVADMAARLAECPTIKYVIPLGREAWALFGLKGNMEDKAGIPTVIDYEG